MELNRPLATVTPTLDGDVLAILAQHQAQFTTGQLHRMLRLHSQEGIRKALGRLVHQGVVQAQRLGNAYGYQLNRDHLAAGPIIELANLQGTLLRRIEEKIASWSENALYGAVFGSAARGTMSADSDLDLFLVRSDGVATSIWEEQVAELASTVTKWTGNDTRTLTYTIAELRDPNEEPVLGDVLTDALTVAGTRAWLTRQLREKGSEKLLRP
jgi:predicted nucleotidyltransferase